MSTVGNKRDDIPKPFQLENARTDRLIHLVPDQLAEEVPDHPIFAYPKKSDPQDGFIDISCKRFANAINRTSWYLSKLLGEPKDFDSIGYVGRNDLRYFLFMFAAMKVGFKMCFTSPKNHLDGHLHVLKEADCKTFLYAEGANVKELLGALDMRSEVVPELAELMDEDPVDMYPYKKTFEEARWDPCLVLHTTGTTGLPKAITWKLGVLSTYEAWRTLPVLDDFVPPTEIYQTARRAYTSLPLFHTSGLNTGITCALCLGITLVYGSADVVPNADYIDKMHKHVDIEASMGAPAIYEELSQDQESLESIKNLAYIVVSGAPLSQKAGNTISEHTQVIQHLGATETACLQRLTPSAEDWSYFYWHPTHSGIEMREVDGYYELFIVKDPKLELYQGIFYVFPDIEEWSMNDLYERHPTKEFLYRYRCRKDDIIVLSNGEKITPALMETALNSCPIVKGAMVIGRDKFQPAVLIDLSDGEPTSDEQKKDLIDQLMPFMKDANKHAPAHSKLDRDHIMFATSDKPVKYMGIGKIQRLQTYDLYEDAIEAFYDSTEGSSDDTGSSNTDGPDLKNDESIQEWLKALIIELADLDDLSAEEDFFRKGLDSLQVMSIARRIRQQAQKAGLQEVQKKLAPKAIYKHPNLSELASFIKSLNTEGTDADSGFYTDENRSPNQSQSNISETSAPEDPTQQLVDKYTNSLPPWAHVKAPPKPKSRVVLLTGSTGSLGSYILDRLCQDSSVSRVICLNRRKDADKKHQEIAESRGISIAGTDKVETIQADLAEAYLGLDVEKYEELRTSITEIIHSQWPVNFNWPLSSFEPAIVGVRNLIYFSYTSEYRPLILYVSSVASAASWSGDDDVPEEMFEDTSIPSMGYGQSKYVSEKLLDYASNHCGIKSIVCRVGIVAGPVKREQGMWNVHEYIPSIVVSSAEMGVFPSTFPSRDSIDWLPVDVVPDVLLDLLQSKSEDGKSDNGTKDKGSDVFHVVNPNTISWSDFKSLVLDAYPKEKGIKTVPFEEWVEKLAASESDGSDAEKLPALKLLDFYRDASKSQKSRSFSSRQAKGVSTTMERAEPVNGKWVDRWMQQWGVVR